MRFIDYYKVLGIEFNATEKEIKSAFKREAQKWHPDKNQSKDATERMKLINEAYVILKDPNSRILYDVEYKRYEDYVHLSTIVSKSSSEKTYGDGKSAETNYNVEDEEVSNLMKEAKSEAERIFKQAMEDLSGMTISGLREVKKEIKNNQIVFIVLTIIGLSIFFLSLFI